MYGLGKRNRETEMELRYNAMVNVLSDLLSCGRWDIEVLFDSDNNIEVGEIVREWVENTGELPNWNAVYYEALLNFAYENDLEVGEDVDIFTNACLDTHLFVRKGVDEEIIRELEDVFNLNVEVVEKIA